MLKDEFSTGLNWFKKFNVRLDSGYQGFEKDYPAREVYLPKKAYKKRPLTDEDKLSNQQMASQRIVIEPLRRADSIGNMKRYRILSDRLRVHDFDAYDDVLEVCAGLSNFYLSF